MPEQCAQKRSESVVWGIPERKLAFTPGLPVFLSRGFHDLTAGKDNLSDWKRQLLGPTERAAEGELRAPDYLADDALHLSRDTDPRSALLVRILARYGGSLRFAVPPDSNGV